MTIAEDHEATLPTGSRESKDSDLPERLSEIVEAIGNAPSYTVRIFRAGPDGRMAMVGTMPRLPDPDELGKLYGGGEYELVVQWRTQGVSTGRPNKRTLSFVLGPEYTSVVNAERLRIQQPGQGMDLEKVLTMAERIASIRGGNGDGGNVVVVSMMERIMDRMDRMQERADEKFERMLDKITEANSNRPDPLEAWRNSMVLAKEMGLPIAGAAPEDSRAPWLEVAELVANNAGKFLEMLTEAQKSKAAQFRLMANPMARKVMAQAPALKDPAKRAAMIAHLREKIGEEQTQKIVDAIDGKG